MPEVMRLIYRDLLNLLGASLFDFDTAGVSALTNFQFILTLISAEKICYAG